MKHDNHASTATPARSRKVAWAAVAALVVALAGLSGCSGDSEGSVAADRPHHGKRHHHDGHSSQKGAKHHKPDKSRSGHHHRATGPSSEPTADAPDPTDDATTPDAQGSQSADPQHSSSPDQDPPADAPVARLTPAGTHALDISGTVSSSLGRRPVRPDGSVSVGAPSGATQDISISNSALDYEFTQQLTEGGLVASMIHVKTEIFDVTYAASGGMLLPAHPKAGQTWSWSASTADGRSTLSFSARYIGKGSVSVAGRQVPTHHLAVTLRSTGRVVFDSNSDRQLAASTLLPVSEQTHTTGRSRGISFTADISSVLRAPSGT